MAILFGILTTLVFCSNSSVKKITTEVFSDTTTPAIKPGFYLVINDTTGVAFRKLNSITKNDFANGQTFALSLENYLSFDIIDSLYIQYSTETKYYDIYFRFNNEGQKQFYDLTNRSNDPKFMSDNGLAKLGIVIDETLIQVVSIFGPFNGDTIVLSGIFDEQTVDNLKKQIEKETGHNKN